MQSLTVTQNSLGVQNDANDSLLALAVALRSAANVSPVQQQNHLRQHISLNRNFTTVTNPLLAEKLLSPNLSDLDNLTISNRPHRPPDLKGKFFRNFFLTFYADIKSFKMRMHKIQRKYRTLFVNENRKKSHGGILGLLKITSLHLYTVPFQYDVMPYR